MVKVKGGSKYPTCIKATDYFPRRWMKVRKWIQCLTVRFLCYLSPREVIQLAIFIVVRSMLKYILYFISMAEAFFLIKKNDFQNMEIVVILDDFIEEIMTFISCGITLIF